jgi:hypothetical protein
VVRFSSLGVFFSKDFSRGKTKEKENTQQLKEEI